MSNAVKSFTMSMDRGFLGGAQNTNNNNNNNYKKQFRVDTSTQSHVSVNIGIINDNNTRSDQTLCGAEQPQHRVQQVSNNKNHHDSSSWGY